MYKYHVGFDYFEEKQETIQFSFDFCETWV